MKWIGFAVCMALAVALIAAGCAIYAEHGSKSGFMLCLVVVPSVGILLHEALQQAIS